MGLMVHPPHCRPMSLACAPTTRTFLASLLSGSSGESPFYPFFNNTSDFLIASRVNDLCAYAYSNIRLSNYGPMLGISTNYWNFLNSWIMRVGDYLLADKWFKPLVGIRVLKETCFKFDLKNSGSNIINLWHWDVPTFNLICQVVDELFIHIGHHYLQSTWNIY
jgi:hypothetical protein